MKIIRGFGNFTPTRENEKRNENKKKTKKNER